jgi:hypothetical protein
MARTTVIGACPHDYPDTCSILTTVEDGEAIGVRGNRYQPFAYGRLSERTCLASGPNDRHRSADLCHPGLSP